MNFSKEAGKNSGEKQPKVIDNERDFHYAFVDSKNQFFMMNYNLVHKKMSLEELQNINKNYTYLPFTEYIKKNSNSVLAPKISNDENYKQLIFIHDDLIHRIKNFQTIKELEQILEEVEEFIV